MIFKRSPNPLIKKIAQVMPQNQKEQDEEFFNHANDI